MSFKCLIDLNMSSTEYRINKVPEIDRSFKVFWRCINRKRCNGTAFSFRMDPKDHFGDSVLRAWNRYQRSVNKYQAMQLESYIL